MALLKENAERLLLEGGAAGASYLNLPGGGANYASTPDSAAVSITSDFDIRVDCEVADWSGIQVLVSHFGPSPQYGYDFYISNGFLVTSISDNGTSAVGATSSTTVPFANGERARVGVRWNDTTNQTTFWTSTDFTTWTQLGTAVTLSKAGVFNSNAELAIGRDGESGGLAFTGKMYRAQIRNNALDDGTGIVFDANFETQSNGATSFVESSSNGATVTINGSASIVGSGGTSLLLLESDSAGGGGGTTNASAGSASGAAAAQQARASIAANAQPLSSTSISLLEGGGHELLEGGGTALLEGSGLGSTAVAYNATAVSVAGTNAAAGNAPAAAVAYGLVITNVKASPGVASGAGSARQPTTIVGHSNSTSQGAATGSTGAWVIAGATAGAATGTANNATPTILGVGSGKTVSATPGVATSTGAANGPSRSVAPTMGVASADGVAWPGAVTIPGKTDVQPALASATGTAFDVAGGSGGARPGSPAGGTGTARDAVPTVDAPSGASAGLAAVPGAIANVAPPMPVPSAAAAAFDATVAAQGVGVASAEVAVGAGTAPNAAGAVTGSTAFAGAAHATSDALAGGPALRIPADFGTAAAGAVDATVSTIIVLPALAQAIPAIAVGTAHSAVPLIALEAVSDGIWLVYTE